MSPVLDRDYSQWGDEHQSWTSIQDFITGSNWRDGVHTISIGAGPTLDVSIFGNPISSNYSVVPIFLSGAVQKRDQKSGPFFSGAGVSAAGGFPYISISDPSLELDDSLGLAWYAGSEEQDLTASLLGLLNALANASNMELLLIGGSGGGFAALRLGQKLGAIATVFVWNAQTDILEYNQKFAQNYLRKAYPNLSTGVLDLVDWKREIREKFDSANIELSLLPDARGGRVPRRLLFVQNATDWHVPVHTAPFIEARGLQHVGRGLYNDGPDQILWITHFGDDHQPLSVECVKYIVQELLDPAKTPDQIVATLKQSGLMPEPKPGKEPRDLRAIGKTIADNLSLSLMKLNDEQLEVRVNLADVPAGYGGLTFGYFTVDQAGNRKNVRWFSTDTQQILDRDDSQDLVQVVVRDGFNNELFSVTESVQPELPLKPKVPNVFIYGSCVSRDAFQFDHKLKLADYVARSPLGSAFAKPPSSLPADTASIASRFQRRMVEIDLSKRLGTILRETEYDTLLVDLVDERIPLLTFDDSVVAYSAELQSTGLQASPGTLVAVGSDDYYSRWAEGLSALLDHCLSSKIVINKVWWATHASDGTPLNGQDYIKANNDVLDRLYAQLSQVEGIRFIEYPEDLMVADVQHKWGAAPYHFVPDASKYMLTRLQSMLSADFSDGSGLMNR